RNRRPLRHRRPRRRRVSRRRLHNSKGKARNRQAFHHSKATARNHMKRLSSKTWKIGGGVLVVLLVLFAILSRSKGDNASAADTSKLEAVTVGSENIAVATTGSIMSGPTISGTLEPEREAVLRAQVQGSVLQTYADQGQAVSAGTVLARIAATGIQDAYNSARAGVVAARNSADIASKDLARNRKLRAAGEV